MKHKQETRQILALRRREADCEKYAKILAKVDKKKKDDIVCKLDDKEITKEKLQQKFNKAQQDVTRLTEKLQKAGALTT